MELAFACSGCAEQLRIAGNRAGTCITCKCGADTVAPPLKLGPGLILKGFLLERHLGKGAMGDVFLGRQLSMDRAVAIKTLPAQMTLNDEAVGRFLHEVQITAQMSHPNIVTAFDAGEDDGTYFFAMAYVDGEDYKKQVERDGAMDEMSALDVVRDVSRALRYAWDEFRILHRDVKPENIMIDRHGTVRLMDMGISKSMKQDGGMTVEGMVVGTPHYMSPEQAWSEAPIDFRSDMYSVGATAYYLLTGSPPYKGTVQAVFQMLAKPEPIKPIRQANPRMSAPTAVLIDTMLSPNADDRHPNWDDFLEDLERVRAGKMPKHRRPDAKAGQMWPTTAPATKAQPGNASVAGTMSTSFSLRKLGGDTPSVAAVSVEENTAPPETNGESATTEPPKSAQDLQLDSGGTPVPEAAPTAAELSPPAAKSPVRTPAPSLNAPPAPKSPLRLAEPPQPARPAAPPAPAPELESAPASKKGVMIAGAAIAAAILITGIVVMNRSGSKGPQPAVPPSSGQPQNDPPTPVTAVSEPRQKPDKPALLPSSSESDKQVARWLAISAADREQLDKEIAARIEAMQQKFTIDGAAIAARLQLPWPLPTPPDRAALETQVNDAVAAAVAVRYPPRDFVAEALAAMGPYQIGTPVTLTLKYDKGTINGTLREVGIDFIKVDTQKIPFHQLQTADRDRMSEVTAKARAEEAAQATILRYQDAKDKLAATEKPAIQDKIFQAAGFRKKGAEWVSAQEIYDAEVANVRTAELERSAQKIRIEVYQAAGYALRGNIWGRTSE